MWKFHDNSITQILREINFGESRRSKSAFSDKFRGPEFVSLVNFNLPKVKNFIKIKIQSSECVKMAVIANLDPPKAISRKGRFFIKLQLKL